MQGNGKIWAHGTLTNELHKPIIGNAVIGSHCENIHIINELQQPIYIEGLENVVVAACSDGIFVCGKDYTEEIKNVVENLTPRSMCEEQCWGTFRVLDDSIYEGRLRSLTKSITLKAGKHISYQIHRHRSKVWTFVQGEGVFMFDGVEKKVKTGDTVLIPVEHSHVIKAITPLTFIEIQYGNPFVKEDIESIE